MASSNTPDLNTALVTGAAIRIGKEIALTLANNNMDVVVHYHSSQKQALQLVEEIKTLGKQAWAVHADLQVDSDCKMLIEKSQDICNGRLTLLVNSASIYPESTIESVCYEDFMESFRVNAWAPFLLSRCFALSVSAGNIVNIVDNRIYERDKNHLAYIISKHALAALTAYCASSFGPQIRVNGIAPGFILPPKNKSNEEVQTLLEKIPLSKRATVLDVAEAVVSCLRNEYLTGEIVCVPVR